MKSGDDAQKAWKRVRDRYVREVRAIEAATRSGSGFVRKKQWAFLEMMSFYDKHIRPRKATTNVKAPPVGDTAQCLLMEMVESSPDDSTIPTDFEPAQEELQCSPEAPVPATPSTSVVSTSSPSRRSSGQS
ncbi:uncharacterized protein LOC120843497 [Ixodes scapularis]|uniref:uncharacterized protein LOC120843497 n=1 Tax=Ixodes scapularis TaxID=6945 RepID=UPI001A9CE945|nr:uncharacterized protein LOC120843497 [Ixodes scapularis]